MSLAAFIKDRARELGFQAVGFCDAADLEQTEEVLLQRIDAGLFSGLSWFTPARARLACRPRELLPNARAVISLAASYKTSEPDLDAGAPAPRGRIARYAWGKDYHDVLKARMRQLVDAISRELGCRPGARCFVDSSPLADRAVAQKAGTGWFGKNTNILVHGLGSWTFLGAIILDVDLPPDEPLLTHCGSCTLCIDACPTGALLSPYVLDNQRCISYQTIENRGSIPQELRPLLGAWVFGCDICQDVCPVNRKAVQTDIAEFQAENPEAARPALSELLKMDMPTYQQRFRGKAVKRAKQPGLQRNAAVALGNARDPEALPALEQAMDSPHSVVRSHAAWAIGRIGTARARRLLERARAREDEGEVREEIERALQRGPA